MRALHMRWVEKSGTVAGSRPLIDRLRDPDRSFVVLALDLFPSPNKALACLIKKQKKQQKKNKALAPIQSIPNPFTHSPISPSPASSPASAAASLHNNNPLLVASRPSP
jgi:hypothetical protein